MYLPTEDLAVVVASDKTVTIGDMVIDRENIDAVKNGSQFSRDKYPGVNISSENLNIRYPWTCMASRFDEDDYEEFMEKWDLDHDNMTAMGMRSRDVPEYIGLTASSERKMIEREKWLIGQYEQLRLLWLLEIPTIDAGTESAVAKL